MAALMHAPDGEPRAPLPAPVAVLELLDRDGQVRQTLPVAAWPLRIGRALDNDVVLSDAHVAPHHLALRPADATADTLPAATLALAVGDTRNGVHAAGRHWRAGETAQLAPNGDAIELSAGRTRLRLRLPGLALAPEQPLAVLASRRSRLLPVAVAAPLLIAALVFSTYLQNDPETFGRAVGGMLLTAAGVAGVWCAAWALLSKTFTRQAHFGWHVRVFVLTALALLVVDALPGIAAFAFSWPTVSDFSFVATYLVGATGIYFHLLAVEPARHRLLKGVAAVGALAAIALTLWFNLQRSDRYGEELYMYHLLPPGLRVARPIPADAFVTGLAALKPGLDRKARDAGGGDDDANTEDDDDN